MNRAGKMLLGILILRQNLGELCSLFYEFLQLNTINLSGHDYPSSVRRPAI